MAAKQKTYWWAWLVLGATICLVVTNHHWFDKIKSPAIDFFNSNFSTAFFGAVAGSLTIIIIDWMRKQTQVLADINTSIGLLSSLSNTLLNVKSQHTAPLYQNYQRNLGQFETVLMIRNVSGSEGKGVPLKIPMDIKKFFAPDLTFDLPTDRLFTLTHEMPQIVMLLTQTKRSVVEISRLISLWNELIDDFRTIPSEQKIPFYFGKPIAEGENNTVFPDTVANLYQGIDDALFFVNRSIRALDKLGQSTLPFWLRKKIAKSEIVSKKHQALMPAEDHIEGWQ